jgi:hypothetical protein
MTLVLLDRRFFPVSVRLLSVVKLARTFVYFQVHYARPPDNVSICRPVCFFILNVIVIASIVNSLVVQISGVGARIPML